METHAQKAAQWLSAARAGSPEAVGQALEACRAYLLLIAQQQLEPDLQAKGGASDLVQETFLEAHRDFGRFDGRSEGELLAWLRQLLLNNLANFRDRYRGTKKRQLGREVQPGSLGPPGGADSATPSRMAMDRERTQALLQALDRLPEDYRRVLTLRYLEDRPFAEIGEQLNRSADAARKLWARAVERLQQELDAAP